MKRLLIVVFAICIHFVGCGFLQAEVRLTEIMADPPGSEFRNEFVEFANLGSRSVDLESWTISDGQAADLLDFAGTSILEPGQICLIIDPDYHGGDTPYGGFPTGVLVAEVRDRTIGSGGLDNVHPERVTIQDAQGDEIDSVIYAAGGLGRSYEARVTHSGTIVGWDFSRTIGGSPGSANSISDGRTDVSLSFLVAPDTVLAAEGPARVILQILNDGGRAATSAAVYLTWDETDRLIAVEDLERGESVDIQVDLPVRFGTRILFEAVVVLTGDQDPSNDVLTWPVTFGVPAGAVVISELMPVPVNGVEWVEIRNLLDEAVSLDGWTLVDDADRGGKLPPVTLLPDAYAVLYPKGEVGSATWLQMSSWPSLNNGGDRVRLLDAAGVTIDEVVYDRAVPGRSIERIQPNAGSLDPLNWLVNALDSGGTPGKLNRAEAPTQDLGVRADPAVFDDVTSVSATLPFPRATASLHIFDLNGRLRRRLIDRMEVGALIRVSWDGRDDGRKLLRPGPYILYLEAVRPDGEIVSDRTHLVYAKGL